MGEKHVPTPSNKGLIAGLIKGNQWVFIVPDHKGRLFLAEVALGGQLGFPWNRAHEIGHRAPNFIHTEVPYICCLFDSPKIGNLMIPEKRGSISQTMRLLKLVLESLNPCIPRCTYSPWTQLRLKQGLLNQLGPQLLYQKFRIEFCHDGSFEESALTRSLLQVEVYWDKRTVKDILCY